MADPVILVQSQQPVVINPLTGITLIPGPPGPQGPPGPAGTSVHITVSTSAPGSADNTAGHEGDLWLVTA